MDNYVYNLAIRYLRANGISNIMVEDTKINISEENNDIEKEKINREMISMKQWNYIAKKATEISRFFFFWKLISIFILCYS